MSRRTDLDPKEAQVLKDLEQLVGKSILQVEHYELTNWPAVALPITHTTAFEVEGSKIVGLRLSYRYCLYGRNIRI